MQKYNFLQHNPNNSKRKFKKKTTFLLHKWENQLQERFHLFILYRTKEKEHPQHKIYKKYKL